MPAYVWKGKTRRGVATSGERVADSKDAVIAMLRREQVLVTSIKEKGKEFALPKLGGGIKPKDIAIFTRQFSVMIDAGLPLVQCLEILGTQQENANFQKVLLGVRQDVEGGFSLADAMKKHPQAFDNLYTNMIAAGEAGGILDTILKRLAVYIEKSVKLKSQVQSAMIYPIAVVSIAGLVVGVILWKVIPTFAALFAGLGAQLPLPTRIVIGLSNWFGSTLAVSGRRLGRSVHCAPQILCDLQRSAGYRWSSAETSHSGHDTAEDLRGKVLPDSRDTDVEWCSYLGRAGDHSAHLRERHHRRRDHGYYPEERGRRADSGSTAQGHRGVSIHGGANDLGRRANRCARYDALENCGFLRG